MRTLFIKFWAFIYRRTGYYLPFIDYFIYKEALEDKWTEIMAMSVENELPIECGIGIEIGTWQAEHGFYRPWKGWKEFNKWAEENLPKKTDLLELENRLKEKAEERAEYRKEASKENIDE